MVFHQPPAVNRQPGWRARSADALKTHCSAQFLPASYISEAQTRIQAYRALAEVTTQEQLDRLRGVWRDRFGRLPEAAESLFVFTAARLVAAARKITRVEVRDRKLMLTRGGDYILLNGKFPRLSAATPVERLREMLALLRKF